MTLTHAFAAALTGAVAFAPAAVWCQRPAKPGDPISRFRALPEEQRTSIVRRLEREVLLDDDERVQTIVSYRRTFESYPLSTSPPFHDPGQWAPGVAPARSLVPRGAPAHDAVAQRFPNPAPLDNLNRAVWYDWQRGEIVRRTERLTAAETYENLLHGFPPGTDEAIAAILAALDDEPDQRTISAYLGHLYADLDANVYEGVSLYQAWYSGRVLQVPDVDAIPFAVGILDDRSYRSPIPANHRRQLLYQQIRRATLQNRIYRTMREAAAVAFVSVKPLVQAPYDELLPRFHYLWNDADDDPEALAARLREFDDRAQLIETVDRRVRDEPAQLTRRDQRLRSLAAMAYGMRRKALDALPAEPAGTP